MKPPFAVTNKIITKISSISNKLGKIESSTLRVPEPRLRKQNKIKTIQATLAIEGNTLSLDQVTAVLEGKKVIGEKKEITEVLNALEMYEMISEIRPHDIKDFLHAHKVLMKDLLKNAGNFRSKNVGVLKGTKVGHIAPRPQLVRELISNLFSWIKNDNDTHPLIMSCVVHYEIEFIHPFEDGNGRMGRFWQSILLSEYEIIFRFLPIESLVKDNQQLYYDTLEACDKKGDSTSFIELILTLIDQSLSLYVDSISGASISSSDRLEDAKTKFKLPFSRKEYMTHFKNISSATASRDLKEGVQKKMLKKVGTGNQTKYIFHS